MEGGRKNQSRLISRNYSDVDEAGIRTKKRTVQRFSQKANDEARIIDKRRKTLHKRPNGAIIHERGLL